MAYELLTTYLNDHLAGAETALELLTHLETTYAGTEREHFFTTLRADVAADRAELEVLMARLQISQSAPRKAAAWLAEKVTQLKLRLDDSAGGPLYLLESLEAVAIGIEGKRALWRALDAAAADAPELQEVDYDRLERRAEEQRRRVEEVRLEAAVIAFGGGCSAFGDVHPDSLVPRPIDHPHDPSPPPPNPPGEDEPPSEEPTEDE